MKNFEQNGDVLDIIAPAGGMVSGKPVIVGSLASMAMVTAAEGQPGTVSTRGVFTYAKKAGDAVTLGAKLYYDAANDVLTVTAAGAKAIGLAASPAVAGSSTASFMLVQAMA